MPYPSCVLHAGIAIQEKLYQRLCAWLSNSYSSVALIFIIKFKPNLSFIFHNTSRYQLVRVLVKLASYKTTEALYFSLHLLKSNVINSLNPLFCAEEDYLPPDKYHHHSKSIPQRKEYFA